MKKKVTQESRFFEVKDCAIIRRMGGVDPAINLREVKERLSLCPIECLYFHFCEASISPTFDDQEFRNDFAVWAAKYLRDRILAERLGILNPYKFDDFEQLREKVIEIIDERLAELQYVPAVRKGDDFIFMQAATVLFDTGIKLYEPADLKKHLPAMSNSSIYYHFLEARRRTPDRTDDFTFWLQFFEKPPKNLITALSKVNFYFKNLFDLKQALIETVNNVEL